MTLQQLSAALGYKYHSYLSELEAGEKVPTADLVLRIARLFNVSTDELLKDELGLPEDRPAGEASG
jgi:transcriptional regulator with XRE-family HTH domain